MHASFVEARAGIEDGDDTVEILRRVKRVAAFSGPLRTNLVSMLDGIGVPVALRIESTAELFMSGGERLLHSTSAIRYPVFKADRNYTGSAPSIVKSPLLVPYLDLLATEVESASRSLIVPLGKSVEAAMRFLIERELVAEERCLFGFPHPSGANAHRAKQYATNRSNLGARVEDWFSE